MCHKYQGHDFIKPECTKLALIIAVVVVLTYSIFIRVLFQLKNARQMQQAAEAAKRHEEEILRAKAEQQQQQQDDTEHNKVELSNQADVSEPSKPAEQSVMPETEQTSDTVESVVEPTAADQESSAKTVSEVSLSAANSEQVTAEVNTEVHVVSDSRVHDDTEPNRRLRETEHHETENAVTESATEVPQTGESSEKPENLENASGESAVVNEPLPVVVVASSDGDVVLTADVSTQSDLSHTDTVEDTATGSGIQTGQEQPSELPLNSEQLVTDADKTKLDIADDVLRSVSDESSDAYTDVLESETDHLSDILEGQDKPKRKEDIEYVELCDESSSTMEPNASKEDNKEETEKEFDSILDDVHLDESEHGNQECLNL